MQIGIIGLPKSGKTVIFNALTKGKVSTSSHTVAGAAPNIGVAKVLDSRLADLEAIFKPKRVIYPDIKYIDLAPTLQSFGKGLVLGGQFLNFLNTVDALIHVVRNFEEPAVLHVEGTVNPQRDIATMDLELIFSDIAIVERRLQKIEASLKGARAHEKDLLLLEQHLFFRIKSNLEKEIPLKDMCFTDEESRILENYQLLTAKPLIILLNIGENKVGKVSSLEQEIRSTQKGQKLELVSLCGQLEMELTQLEEKEAEEFRSALGLKESMIDRIVQLSYALVDLISFFTVVSGEVRGWTIKRGTTALKAAGKIHSDMEKGFIRAEVVSHDDLMKCGNIAEARKRGLVRLEGKNYVVQDGDIITFLFNV